MKNIINTIPGYKLYEYLLVLNPHDELRNKILQVKQQFAEEYKSTAVPGKPNITLASFNQYEMMEERIKNRLKTLAMGFPPIKVELKNYSSFPSHSIYINVTSKVPLQSLVKKIRTEAQQLMKLNETYKPHFILEPYITIARKLQPGQYDKAWTEFKQKHFTGRFIADGMLLLKRPAGEMSYQVRARFDFENLPVSTTQGELFA